MGRTELRLLIGATALASVLVALGPAAAYWSENHTGTIDPSPPRLPRSLSGWVVADPVAEWHPVFGAPDGLLSVQLSDPSADDRRGVDLAIYRYDRIRKGHELIESTNRLWDDERWHLLGAHALPVQLGARSTAMIETVIGSPAGRRLIWSCYWIDDHPTTSGMAVKLSPLKTMFTGHESAALLAISTPIDGVIGDARTRLASVARTPGRHLSSVLSGAGATRPRPAPTQP